MAKKIFWSVEKESAFIDLVHEKPALWNPLDAHYSKKSYKKTLYESIVIEMVRRWPEDEDLLTSEILRKKFCSLRTYFQREEKRARLPSGSAGLDIVPKWVHYQRLLFLKDTINIGSSASNLDDSFASDAEFLEPVICIKEVPDSSRLDSDQFGGSDASRSRQIKISAAPEILDQGPPPKKQRQVNVEEDILNKRPETTDSFPHAVGQIVVSTLKKLAPPNKEQFIRRIFELIMEFGEIQQDVFS